MGKHLLLVILVLFIINSSCEEVIEVDLEFSDGEFVVEAVISKDSVCKVKLTKTTAYFSAVEPEYIEDAEIEISNGIITEELDYAGYGIYRGNNIIGSEGIRYGIEIRYKGKTYTGNSYMYGEPQIINIHYSVSYAQSSLNPKGERVVTISCTFSDDIEIDNYYLIRFSDEKGKLIERYYLLTENESNSGNINYDNGNISFSESVFYEGNYIDVKVFSVDKPVYDYFLQLTDILFWKRRIMPPTPYNPISNISNGALGYFAAWSLDSETIILE